MDYDAEGDVLYLSFAMPQQAMDSVMGEDGLCTITAASGGANEAYPIPWRMTQFFAVPWPIAGTSRFFPCRGALDLQEVRTLPEELAIVEAPEILVVLAPLLYDMRQAKARELCAAMSLARLWQEQGKRNLIEYNFGPRVLLAPIYGWCTEGFDTADLQDTRALLEELE
jgi:hypothetical protein